MAKKRRVPEILWKLFRERARTLADTIKSMVSQSSGEATNAFFLIKRGDPTGYRKLLHQCFVVVNEEAPHYSGFSPIKHWSQHEIVERIMEMSQILETPNVIYGGFDKYHCSSPILELLSCSSWSLLLERVGENVMCYLLQHTSIFLPLPPKRHHQVTGPPISSHEFFKSKADFQGYQKKRKIVDIACSVSETQQEYSVGCVGCNEKRCVWQFRRHPDYKNGQMNVFGVDTATSCAVVAKIKGNTGEPQTSCDQVTAKPRKRSRPFRWQRHRKCRHIELQEFSDKKACKIPCDDKNSSCGKHLYDNNRMQEKCSCCLMLQAHQFVTDRDHINRRFMFYSLEYSSTVLPHRHILNSLKPNISDSKILIKRIFGLSDVNKSAQSMACSHSGDFCLMGSACLYHKLVRLLKLLLRRFQTCQHLRLLEKHCVPSSDQKGNELGKKVCGKSNVSCIKDFKKSLEAGDSHFEALKPYCLKSQVESFIWAVCRSIIPADLLGTPSNWRVLRRNISKFIQLRRFEKFSIKQCMHKLKISKFPFLSDKHSSCYLKAQVPKDRMEENARLCEEFSKLNNTMLKMKHKLLANWIFWFFSHLVLPLVQANFYVTETEHGKQDIYYYRKSVWENLMNKAITSLKDKSYCQLDDATLRSVISKRSFGFSKLRLLPKENGVRMLANLKAPSKLVKKEFKDSCSQMLKDAQMYHKTVKFDYFKSINGVLRDMHAALKGLVVKEPDKLGSSVFDYNDVYRKLCPFLIGLRNASTIFPGIFVVVSDVSKAFDSIDQDRLLSVMNDVILEDKFLLEHPYQVVCTKKSMKIHDNPVLIDHNISTGTRFTSSLSVHSILVNQGRRQYVKKSELEYILNQHVKRNVLQLDKKFYLQGIGIAQGSVISSLLCSLYYGDMERNVIYPFIEKTQESDFQVLSESHQHGENSQSETIISSPSYIIDLEKPLGKSQSILLRFIDDILFISTSKKQATKFFHRLWRGFPNYNCYMNEEKFCVNFDVGHTSGLSSNRIYVGADGVSFLRWSGLLINCSTAEVQGDYTRYWKNHLSSTLTVCWQGKPGHHLKSRLCAFMRPKCHPMFFDSNINSAAVVRLNIYQAFLLCAMKFHCYVSNLSYICKLRSSFYLKIIERSLRYMHMLIKRRMQSVNVGLKFQPVLRLEDGEVEWLGLNAYVKILKRKQSRHKELLSMLRSKLLVHRITGSPSDELKYAIDGLHSSLFWKIKY